MKKFVKDLRVEAVEFLREDYILLRLSDPSGPLPEMIPGQFVQIAVEGSPSMMRWNLPARSTLSTRNAKSSTYSFTQWAMERAP